MTDIFLRVLNMSIAAGWLVLAIIILRFILKKGPRWIFCLLWGTAGLRLIFPFSLESIFSLVPSWATVSQAIMYEQEPSINSGIDMIDKAVNPILADSFAPSAAMSMNPMQAVIFLLSLVWIAGAAVMLGFMAVSWIRLRRRMSTATLLTGNIRQSEYVKSPFILGIVRPRIYIPYHLGKSDFENVIAHENAHLKRRDHLVKPLAFLILTIHWFNPLVWLGYILLCRDIELACDEKVIKGMDKNQRKAYSKALLACNTSRRSPAPCPLAFGEAGVGERVIHVKTFKEPSHWLVISAAAAGIVIAVGFLTNPAPAPFGAVYQVEAIQYDAPQYSFSYTEETMPYYSLSNSRVLRVKGDILSEDLSEPDMQGWNLLGKMEEIKLNPDNFDSLFLNNSDGGFMEGISAQALRRDNKKTWQLVVENENNSILYYLLWQKNGDVYLSYGYLGPEKEPSSIRWLFKLSKEEPGGNKPTQDNEMDETPAEPVIPAGK